MAPLRYFNYDHLPKSELRDMSRRFQYLAIGLDRDLPDGPAKSIALRKLLEAKDAAVRSLAVDGKETHG